MISLRRKDHRKEVVLDYNNNSLLAIYVVLMLFYIRIIVIYDGVCMKDMLDILYGDVFLTLMKTWLT